NAQEERNRAQIELKGLQRMEGVCHPFIHSPESVQIQDGKLMVVTELASTTIEEHFRALRKENSKLRTWLDGLDLLRDVAEALDHMHERQQLQHLDIKPSNLLIVGKRCKISDFGTVAQVNSKGLTEGPVALCTRPAESLANMRTVTYRSCRDVPWHEAL